MPALILRMIGTELSRNPGILASRGNPASYVQAAGSGNMSPVLPGKKPWSDLSHAGHNRIIKTLEQQKSYASFSN